MNDYLSITLVVYFLFIFSFVKDLSAEENFLLIDGTSNAKIYQLGTRIEERMTPCSTFKIALSLMGFDAEILIDEKKPVWIFQDGYDDFLDSWKNPQTPLSWMKTSCIWYSRVLTKQLGVDNFQMYLDTFQYGNQDASGGLTNAWLCSSLKISLKEQVDFIQKMVKGNLSISKYAVQMTKDLLFIEEILDGWKLYGKMGWSGTTIKPDGKNEIGWFVGWIEKDNQFFPFAYNIRENKINLSQRMPRVKQLLTCIMKGDSR